MQLFLSSDPIPLPKPLAERVAAFFQSDTCKAIRTVARSHAVRAVESLAEHACKNAQDYLRQDTISEKSRESFTTISRYSIFLQVLEEIETSMKENPLMTIEKIKVDQE